MVFKVAVEVLDEMLARRCRHPGWRIVHNYVWIDNTPLRQGVRCMECGTDFDHVPDGVELPWG